LAIHKSAIKRAKQNKDRNLRNKANRTQVKNVIKSLRAAIDEKSLETAQHWLRPYLRSTRQLKKAPSTAARLPERFPF
jgi:small subunit ribosomal protein S20